MTWWMASILANCGIAVVEYLNRAGGYENFAEAALRTSPFILVAQYGLFHAWNGAPSFMLAWAFFTAGNLGVRLISNHFLVGESMGWVGYLGVMSIVAGAQLVKHGTAH